MSFLTKEFTDPDIIGVTEFIKNRLYFVTYKNKVPEITKKVHYFTANDDYTSDENAEPISRVSLGTIYQFVHKLNKKLTQEKHKEKVIVNYSTGSERKRCNAAVLIGVFAVTHLDMSPERVAEKLSQHSTISPLDSLKAVQKAITFGLISFNSFNAEDFYSLDDVKLNWVIPNKFVMFNGPIETSNGRYLSPRRLIRLFHYMGIQAIIRFCHIKYDANPFVGTDFPHYDINLRGPVPTDKSLEIFLELSEECEGPVLVHCREFLGRAGCLVAAYLIKHFGLTAGEAVAWVRICTSECILEEQKNWLKNKEVSLLKAGEKSRKNKTRSEQWQGICGYSGKEVPAFKGGNKSDKLSSCTEDVTAQLEKEIWVFDTDVKEQHEHFVEISK